MNNADPVVMRYFPVQEASEYDVIVVGGGPTGCTAAAASAREGARTLLIEASAMLGGSGTGALVPSWCPFSDKKQIIYRGLAETILNRCKRHQPHVPPEQLDWVPIDPELLKRVYDDLLDEHGVDILFQTHLSAVDRGECDSVEAIIVTNKKGLTRYHAKVFIDCTGDADLCAWAGAEFHKGDGKGDLMPATHCFTLSNVDVSAFHSTCASGRRLMGNHPDTRIYDIIKSGRYPLIHDAHVVCTVIGPELLALMQGIFGMWTTLIPRQYPQLFAKDANSPPNSAMPLSNSIRKLSAKPSLLPRVASLAFARPGAL